MVLCFDRVFWQQLIILTRTLLGLGEKELRICTNAEESRDLRNI